MRKKNNIKSLFDSLLFVIMKGVEEKKPSIIVICNEKLWLVEQQMLQFENKAVDYTPSIQIYFV